MAGILLDSNGNYIGPRKTYASAFQVVAAAAANAFVTITAAATGSTRVLRLTSIRISGATLTAAAPIRIGLRKYTSQATGGTFTAQAIAIEAPPANASTCVLNAYTVAPTGGLAGGVSIREYVIGALATGSAGVSNESIEQFDTNRTEVPSVIGSTECLGIAFIAAPASAVTLTVNLEWTEDNA